ncbi:MAG: hypothetical protein J5931_00480 [Prevotella sp.]|nr:hypothetical protein [Prevotella sp.]
MKRIVFLVTMLCLAWTIQAQKVYQLTAPVQQKVVKEGHLNMGGTSPSGGSVAVNSYYMSI